MVKITKDMFTRVKNDNYGNPRYALHYLNILEEKENNDVFEGYNTALKKNKSLKLGGRKFHNKQYGGGLVFQSHSIDHTAEYLNEKLNRGKR